MLKNRNFVVSSFSIDRRAQESNMNYGVDETRADGEETALAMFPALHGRVVRDKKRMLHRSARADITLQNAVSSDSRFWSLKQIPGGRLDQLHPTQTSFSSAHREPATVQKLL